MKNTVSIGVFKTMSNICDGGFLQKLLTAEYQSQMKFTDFYYNRVHLRQDHFKFC